MLKQEPWGGHAKKNTTFSRTKNKFSLTKMGRNRHAPPSRQHQPPAFNDPLYEHLDGEVNNREQHNFGPWVQHQRNKSRQRGRGNAGAAELPLIYRPQDTTSRYFPQIDTQNAESIDNSTVGLPQIRERGQRAFSLQNLRPASLEFNPDEIAVRTRITGARTPFFLKMQGYAYPKGEVDCSKKSNFIYNYCFQEPDPCRLLIAKAKDLPLVKPPENYLKMANGTKSLVGQVSTNQQLFLELKQHRINKFK